MQGLPLIAAEDNLIAVTLPGGYVAVYEARLPFKAPLNLHLTQWTRPLFVLTMLIVGVWQYKRSRSAFLPCPVLGARAVTDSPSCYQLPEGVHVSDLSQSGTPAQDEEDDIGGR